jgi:hypothetical protein|nr:hypothetical protein [Bifidobacterium mongoliense]
MHTAQRFTPLTRRHTQNETGIDIVDARHSSADAVDKSAEVIIN